MVGILIYDQDYCCLEPPAKINVHRKKNGGGKTQFLLNDRVIGELRNEEVSVFSTEAVNVVSKRTNRDTDSRKVKCAVRPGETVTVHFCGYTVVEFQRGALLHVSYHKFRQIKRQAWYSEGVDDKEAYRGI